MIKMPGISDSTAGRVLTARIRMAAGKPRTVLKNDSPDSIRIGCWSSLRLNSISPSFSDLFYFLPTLRGWKVASLDVMSTFLICLQDSISLLHLASQGSYGELSLIFFVPVPIPA